MKLMKKHKILSIIIGIVAALFISCVALIPVLMNADSANVQAKTASGKVAELWDQTDTRFNKANLSALANNAGYATFDDMITAGQNSDPANPIKSSELTRNGEFVVTLGGIDWIPVCLTKNTYDRAVLTLWQAEDLHVSRWSDGVIGGSAGTTPPQNIYGTSYMRAVTLNNGGTYASYRSGTRTEVNYTAATIDRYALFTAGSIKGVLCAPETISWQANESADKNDLAYSDDGKYTGISTYYSWKRDKLWLPSVSEVYNSAANGADTVDGGLWGTNANQRSNTNYSAWLRTGYDSDYFGVYGLDKNGEIGYLGINDNFAVRPAIHLDLNLAKGTTHNFEYVCDASSSEHYQQCTDCGFITNRTACAFQETESILPTCAEEGKIVFECIGCGGTHEEQIPCPGHIWGPWTVEKVPNESDPGRAVHTCSVCGIKDYKVLEPGVPEDPYDPNSPVSCSAHLFKEVAPTQSNEYLYSPASCDWAGYGDCICLLCGKTYEGEIPVLGHDFKNESIVLATCEHEGYRTEVCTRCGRRNKIDVVSPFGHIYGAPVWNWAADNSAAEAVFTCSRGCGRIINVPATIDTTITPSTCLAEGTEICNATVTVTGEEFGGTSYSDGPFTKAIPTIGHTYSTDWSSDRTNHWHAATCETSSNAVGGFEAHTYGDDRLCTACGAIEQIFWGITTISDNGVQADLILSVDQNDVAASDIAHGSFDYNYTFTSTDLPPWSSYINSDAYKIVGAEIKASGDKYVAPISTAYWFSGLSDALIIDLRGLDLNGATATEGMLEGCPNVTDIYTPVKNWTDSDLTVTLPETGCCWRGEAGTRITDETLCYYHGNISLTKYAEHIFQDTAMCTVCDEYRQVYWAIDDSFKLTLSNDKSVTDAIVTDKKGEKAYNDGFANSPEQLPWSAYLSDITAVEVNEGKFSTFICEFYYLFGGLTKEGVTIDLSGLDPANGADMIFYNSSGLKAIDLSVIEGYTPYNTESMFYGCSGLTSLDLRGIDFSRATSRESMFEGCSSLKSILYDDNFVTDKVHSLERMFYGCSSLETLDVSKFDTSRVYYIEDMFYGCSSVKELDVSKFDIFYTYNVGEMFGNCSSLTYLDLSSFILEEHYLTGGQHYMFSTDIIKGCTGLQVILAPKVIDNYINLPARFYSEGVGYVTTSISSHGALQRFVRHDLHDIDENHTCTICGDIQSVYWYIDKDYKLIISYDERLNLVDYSECITRGSFIYNEKLEYIPWRGYYDRVQAIEIRECDLGPFRKIKPASTANWFRNFSSVTSDAIDLSGLDTSEVTDMSGMFAYCGSLTSVDLSGLDTSKVTNVTEMFYESGLTSFDFSRFDTSAVTDMHNMFCRCSSLKTLNFSGAKTSSVTNMSGMFSGCRGLISFGVTGLDTSSVTDMSSMFSDCSGLISFDVTGLDTSSVTDMSGMFTDCSGLTSLDVTGLDTSAVTDMRGMFYGCSGLISLDVTGLNTSSVTDMSGIFSGCSSLTSIDLSGFDTSKVNDIGEMFAYCTALTSLDVTGLNTSSVTDMSGIFSGCSSLTSIDLSAFDTSKVESMGGLFYGCTKLTSVDLTGFDTSGVYDMTDMFMDCSSLETIDLSSFNTAKVEGMYNMFTGCSGLKTLDLSNFDLSGVYPDYMEDMLSGCTSLQTLYAPKAMNDKNELVLPATYWFAAAGDSGVLTNTVTSSMINADSAGKILVRHEAHTASDWITGVEKTCTEAGIQYKECTICGETLETAPIESTGHEWEEWRTVSEATEKATGIRARECSVCHTGETQVIPMLNHVHDNDGNGTLVAGKVATCSEAGTREHYKCDTCKLIFDAEKNILTENDLVIPATGHSMGEWEVTTPAGETTAGVKTRKCQSCDYSETSAIPAIGHIHNLGEEIGWVSSTCTESGMQNHYVCSGCGQYFDARKQEVSREELIIPCSGHSWSNWNVSHYASEAHTGLNYRECWRCGAREEIIIPMIEHVHESDLVEEEPASCSSTGLKAHKRCSCGLYFDLEGNETTRAALLTPALGHDYTEWVGTTDRTRACRRCYQRDYDRVPTADHVHNPGELIPEVPAGCSDGMKAHYECTGCDAVFDENNQEVFKEDLVIPATGHVLGDWEVTTQPTETTEGLKTKKCANCDYTETAKLYCIPHTHTFGATVPAKAATCTENGNVAYKQCTGCNQYYDENDNPLGESEIIVFTTGHKMGDWQVVTPASVGVNGVKIKTCINCDYSETAPIPMLGHAHSFTHTDAQAATCTEAGMKAYDRCEGCGLYFDESGKEVTLSELKIAKLPHTAGEWITDEQATCTELGRHHRNCTVCGVSLADEPTPSTGHTASSWIVDVENTCMEAGSKHKECEVCGVTFETSPIAATGHEWEEWREIIAATEEADGVKARECSVCHIGETQVIPMLGHSHSLTHTDAQAATCTEAGMKAYDYCAGCGLYFDESGNEIGANGIVLLATGHTMGEWEETTPATEATDGVKTRTCANCDYSETQVIPMLGHSHSLTHTDAQAATCTEAGMKAYDRCEGCGLYFDESGKEVALSELKIAKLPHTAGEWITDEQATCTATGERHKDCAVCGTRLATEPIPTTGHTAGEWVTDREATCTATGERHKDCAVCGTRLATEPIPATGHTAGEWHKDENGHWKQCTVCNEKLEAEEHSFGEWTTTKQPTTEETGEKSCTCSVCGQEKSETIAKLVQDEGGSGSVSDLPVLEDPDSVYELEITVKATNKIYALDGVNKGYNVQLWIVDGEGNKHDYDKEKEVTLSLIVPEGMEEFTLYVLDDGVFEVVEASAYTVENGVLSIRTTLPKEFVFNSTTAKAGIPWWVWLLVGIGSALIIAAVVVTVVVVKKKKAAAEAKEYDDAEVKAELAEQRKRIEDLENRDDGGFTAPYEGDE